MTTQYLFIDGGCLRAVMKKISDRYFGGKLIKIDFNRLRGGHAKAFYYDAIPAVKEGENEIDYDERIKERQELHNHIASLNGYHVYEGDSRIRRRQVQQKEVDVMIAVDMLTHTFRGNMDRATFIASDLDFKPLLDALVREGMFVHLMYPPADTNQNLVDAADSRQPLAIDTIHGYLEQATQKLISVPNRSMQSKSDFHPKNPVFIQQHSTLGEITYFKSGKEHSVYWNSPENIDCYLRVFCEDYEMLKKYSEDLYLVMLPKNPPE